MQDAGHRLIALTNSSAEAAEGLLGKSGLSDFFEMILSTDNAGACKPAAPLPDGLERAGSTPSGACMVAAHGWDDLGADGVGVKTVWIDRLEKRWPFPGVPPGGRTADLSQVPEAINSINT